MVTPNSTRKNCCVAVDEVSMSKLNNANIYPIYCLHLELQLQVVRSCEQMEGGVDNLGCEELLLDPDKLASLLYETETPASPALQAQASGNSRQLT